MPLRPLPNTRPGSFRSVAEMWNHRASSTPKSIAMWSRQGTTWQPMTWAECDATIRKRAAGLLALGVQHEQRVSLLAETSVSWVITDLAILSAGAATTTIFPSSPADDCRHILADSDTTILFCDRMSQARKVMSRRDELPGLQRIIVFEGAQTDEGGLVMALEELDELGAAYMTSQPHALEHVQAAIEPDHLATLMYTSGTTGVPKGVMLTHDAWVYEAEALDRLGVVSPADKQLLFLPLSHVLAKALMVAFIRLGVPTAIDGSAERILENLEVVQPTWVGAVPRIFEKLRNRILQEADDAGTIQRHLFHWALGVGQRVSRLQRRGDRVPKRLALQRRLADRLVFRSIRERLGGRIRFLVSGGAPLSVDVAEFFHAMGLLICEGYGLTESSAASFVNTPDDFVFGTVGHPLPGVDVRIASDGEILLRSRGVMKGYHKLPEATERAFTEDGWLRTGDIGRILETGHLQITDRKREIIVTASGKNIAPALFQKRLASRSPWVSQALMHGDRRNFCSALVTVDFDAVGRWARDEGIEWTTHAQLSRRPEVRHLVQQAIDDVNRTLPSYEQVRKFAILDHEFSVEDGTLTPSMKMKRRVIEARNQHILDSFYEGTIAT